MRRFLTICLSVLCCLSLSANNGLGFRGMKEDIDSRTSYDVFSGKSQKFEKHIRIAFEFTDMLFPDFGYILRIKSEKSGCNWNLSYLNERKDSVTFRINEEGYFSPIIATVPHSDFSEYQWNTIAILFDLESGEISLTLNNDVFKGESRNISGTDGNFRIVFGRDGFVNDVLTCGIRNLEVSDAKKSFFFCLDEHSDNIVHERFSKLKGKVDNPIWLSEGTKQWKKLYSCSAETPAGVCFDAKALSFHYVGTDFIKSFSLSRRDGTFSGKTKGNCPVNLRTAMCYALPDGRMVIYEPFADGPTVAVLDPGSLEWQTVSSDRITEAGPLHHHANTAADDGCLYLFGGFGNARYGGNLYFLDPAEGLWEKVNVISEDLFPRYFASAGLDESGRYLYIFGGMGNGSGEQVVGRRYFYDLHRIDLATGECSLLWDLGNQEKDFVPVRNLFIDGDSFYTLCYPEYDSNSILRLYSFSLADGSYKIFEPGIPIRSDKICTNANIYFDKETAKMFACLAVYEDDIKSELSVYERDFPPCNPEKNILDSYTIPAGCAAVILVAAAIVAFLIGRRKKDARRAGLTHKSHHLPDIPKNAILTFGGFRVFDREGSDITGSFSEQQRTLMLFLIKYHESGMSSAIISSVLWPDKEEEKVKNSRGVTIMKLRERLSCLEGVSIEYTDKVYRLNLGETFCDVVNVLEELEKDNPDGDKIVTCASGGKFLSLIDDPIFDSFKENVESKLLPFLEDMMKSSFAAKKYEGTTEIAKIILKSDPVSEDATAFLLKSLMKLRRVEDAMVKYTAFTNAYRLSYGENYPGNFKKIIS